MKMLELYCGGESLQSFYTSLGFSVVSCCLDAFSVFDYPRDSYKFDIVFIHITDDSLVREEYGEDEDLYLGMDCIEMYDPKYWVILHNGLKVKDDITFWGLPYRDVDLLRGGKISKLRVWNNIFRWCPRPTNIYISYKTILWELLGYMFVTRTHIKPSETQTAKGCAVLPPTKPLS